jgi:hypothetical protein
MTAHKEQAFQNWLRAECPDLPDNILGSALTQSFKKAFDAGYDARRAEEKSNCTVTSDGVHRYSLYSNGWFCDWCGEKKT